MPKKQIILIGLALALAAAYVAFFSDWFHPKSIQIGHTYRPVNIRSGARVPAVFENTAPVTFTFPRELQFTLIKVVPVAELETNAFPQPVWSLVSDSNSVPVDRLIYGNAPRGMRPANKGKIPEPLQPGVAYRLFVEAGKLKAEHDFKATPKR